MEVYRITLTKWANKLIGSGMPARWNSSGKRAIYTAENRSLACLENIVHRSGEGLNDSFRLIVIQFSDDLAISEIEPSELPRTWYKSVRCPKCRELGDKWLNEGQTAVLRVPSALVKNEFNYVLNPLHDDFSMIQILETESFEFDTRLRR